MAEKDAISRKYDIVKRRLEQQATAGIQQGREALRRQFTRGGLSSSGAAVRAEQQLLQKGQEAKQRAGEAVEMANLAERQHQEDINKQRKFITAERLGAQEFGANQANRQREFITSERLGSQGFADIQAQKTRTFSDKTRRNVQHFQKQLLNIQQNQQWLMFKKNFNLKMKQFNADKDINAFNKDMAMQQLNKKTLVEQLTGWLPGGGSGFGGKWSMSTNSFSPSSWF